MKNNIWIILALISAVAFSLYVRIALPWDNVFTPEWIKFTSVDAYFQMDYVDKIAPVFADYWYRPFAVPFFVWMISGTAWLIGFGNPSQYVIEVVGAYFPAILAALTIIPVYFIGRELFSRGAGIFAAILIAVLPGEWLGRSMLGFTDHHVAAVLFSTTMMLFIILAVRNYKKRRIIYGTLAVVFAVIFYHTETSALYFVLIVTAALMLANLSDVCYGHINKRAVLLFAIVGTIGAGYFLYNINSLTYKLGGFAFGTTAIATMEMRPILFPVGTFTPMVLLGNFGFIILFLPIILALLVYKAARSNDYSLILFTVWCIGIMVLMLFFRRYAYLFAVNAALITGWFIWYAWNALERKYYGPAIMLTAIMLAMMVFPNASNAVATAKSLTFAPSDAWLKTMQWLEENTDEDAVIVSWWDYGYWIKREAHRKAYVNPSQDAIPVKQVAEMMLDGDIVPGDYLILDSTVTGGKYWAVVTWADRSVADYVDSYLMISGDTGEWIKLYSPAYYESLAVRLYNFDGKAVTSNQSTTMTSTELKVIETLDVYSTYREASEGGGIIVGTHPDVSPVDLKAVEGFEKVYQNANIKVFRYAE